MPARTSLDSEDDGTPAASAPLSSIPPVPPPPAAPAPPPAAPWPPPPSPPPPPAGDVWGDDPLVLNVVREMRPPDPSRFKTGAGLATSAFVSELKSSLLVGKAIVAAHHLEWSSHWETSDSECTTDDDDDEKAEHATIAYKFALRQLDKAFPRCIFSGVSNSTIVVAGEENSVPCSCGRGRAGRWPWQLQSHTRGFCWCHLLLVEREEWLRASMGSCFEEHWWQFSHLAAEMVRKARLAHALDKAFLTSKN